MYTNNNLTDEAAERYLAENPKGIVFLLQRLPIGRKGLKDG